MNSWWIKSFLLFIILFPLSVFLHEAGHWMIYEIYGLDSWISLQRANLIHPDQLTETVFLRSLIGGPAVTILLALISYLLLTRFTNSLWLLILGLINATFRILPTIIGILTSFKTNLYGVSDEGNIALRISDSVLFREIFMLVLLSFFILIISRLYKTFRFPEKFKQKKGLVMIICFLTVLISLTYPKLDQIIFGV